MRLLFYFVRSYPASSALMVGALLLAALADGIGVSSVVALFSLAKDLPVDDPQALIAEGGFGGMVLSVTEALGIHLTINVLLGTIVGAMWVKSVLGLLSKRQIGYTVARSATDLRLRLHEALMTTRWSYFIHQPLGAVANSYASEAERASGAYLLICTVVSLLFQSAIYSGVAIAISWRATLGSFAVAFLGLLLLRRLVTATRKAGLRQTRLMRSLLARATDTLQGLKPLKAMAREDRLGPMLEQDMWKLNRAAQKRVLATEALGALQEPLVVTCLALGAWVCLMFLDMPWGTVMGLGLVFARTLLGLAKAQRQYQKFTSQESAFWSMLSMIERAESLREENPGEGGAPPPLEHEIRVNHVDYGYDDILVLEDTSLEIPAGEVTALVGPSGAGKTTISDLIIGLMQPSRGEVLVDGVPLTEIDLQAWRKHIGYVPQEMFLMNGTIFENVTLGEPDLSREQVASALEKAGAKQFIEELPEGMDTIVGERGTRLSGGQRQRISIARALVHDPHLLVLDEATTALDPATEKSVWNALLQLKGQVTILAVSHQPTLAQVASRIYRIENGQARLQDPMGSSAAVLEHAH